MNDSRFIETINHIHFGNEVQHMTTTIPSEASFASTLPGRYYYDPAIYDREQERIFAQMWVCVGHAEALPNPGTYLTVTIGQETIIVIHGKDGMLRAFLNVCRHRGARLCTEAVGQLKGSIQCRYHAWTYGLDGRLIGAPNVLNDAEFNRAMFGLLPVALEIWEGLIWLNLSNDPSPIITQVSEPIVERFGSYAPFARYELGRLKVAKSIDYDVRANWKLIVENFMECYHCGPLHPEFCQLLPGFRSGNIYIVGDTATLADNVEAFTITGKSNRPKLKGLLPEDHRRYYGIVLLPNVLLNLLDDHIVILTLLPQGPDRTHITCDWLFDPEIMTLPDFNPMDAVAIFDIVNCQDWEVCELTQLNMASRAFKSGGIYVPAERHIREFIDFVLAKLQE